MNNIENFILIILLAFLFLFFIICLINFIRYEIKEKYLISIGFTVSKLYRTKDYIYMYKKGNIRISEKELKKISIKNLKKYI